MTRSAGLDTSIEDVRRTGLILTIAQWSVASVVMAGSAYSAGLAFEHFHESFIAGFITGVGVDFALSAWLLIARRLRDAGVHAVWGPVLEGATALMTLCLNAGTSVLQEKYLLAGFHTFLPIVLFILSMAGGEAHQKLRRKLKAKQAQDAAERKAAEESAARQAEDLAEAHRDLSTVRGTRTTERDERAALDKERRAVRQKELDDAAQHRQKLHDEALADVERMQQDLRQAEVDAATRAQQGLQQERDKAAILQQELDEALRVADETRAATAEALAQADANRDSTAQLLNEARADRESAAEEDREAERLRSRAKRTRQRLDEATASQPVSQPSRARVATTSQPVSHTGSPADRRNWALTKLRQGEQVTGADIYKEFGEPRNGTRILAEARRLWEAERDGEVRGFLSASGQKAEEGRDGRT